MSDHINLPEIKGDVWFNSKPLKKEDLAGKVVLVDFWTYSCVNCQRTLPFLKEWWKKYKDKGLIIIGVHTPEFEFEKDPDNVAMAVKDQGVEWPIVMDNDYENWNNFANRYWPAKYLADKHGKIVYTHFGEGGYAETESKIQELLGIEKMTTTPERHTHGSVCFRPTPETYTGYLRGKLANEGGFVMDKEADYHGGALLTEGDISLDGKFIARGEYVESAGPGAKLTLSFSATEVNLVMHATKSESVASVLLNGNPIPDNIRGFSITDARQAKIIKPTLYNFIKSKNLVEGELTISAVEGNYRAYAFTFSGCENA